MSVHSEKTILGAALLEPLAAADASAMLYDDDFSLGSHRDIFRAVHRLASEGCHVDLQTVSETLGPKLLEEIGGRPYLFELTEGIPRNFSIPSYVRIVQNASLARRARTACQDAYRDLADPSVDAAAVLDDLARKLADERPSESSSARDVIPAVMTRLEGGAEVFATGVREVDEMTGGGFRPKEVIVIGALPSAGKSALLRQLERGLMRYGVHTHSVEVPKEEWVGWHAAAIARIPAWKMRQPDLMNAADKQSFRDAAERIAGWNYLIDDAGSVDVRRLLSRSRLSRMRRNIRVHTVDYLQMLEGDGKSKHETFGNAMRDLKRFAKDTNSAVIVLCQLNEGRGDGRGDNRPHLKDLRESGDIRQAADVVILNYRPREDEKYTGLDELIFAKQRNYKIGSALMRFNSDSLTFEPR